MALFWNYCNDPIMNHAVFHYNSSKSYCLSSFLCKADHVTNLFSYACLEDLPSDFLSPIVFLFMCILTEYIFQKKFSLSYSLVFFILRTCDVKISFQKSNFQNMRMKLFTLIAKKNYFLEWLFRFVCKKY